MNHESGRFVRVSCLCQGPVEQRSTLTVATQSRIASIAAAYTSTVIQLHTLPCSSTSHVESQRFAPSQQAQHTLSMARCVAPKPVKRSCPAHRLVVLMLVCFHTSILSTHAFAVWRSACLYKWSLVRCIHSHSPRNFVRSLLHLLSHSLFHPSPL